MYIFIIFIAVITVAVVIWVAVRYGKVEYKIDKRYNYKAFRYTINKAGGFLGGLYSYVEAKLRTVT